MSDQLFQQQVLSRRAREHHANKREKRKSYGEISCLLSIGLIHDYAPKDISHIQGEDLVGRPELEETHNRDKYLAHAEEENSRMVSIKIGIPKNYN